MRNQLIAGERTVLVDMDGVLASFEEANNNVIRKHFPEAPLVEKRPEFYFSDTYAPYPDVVAKIEEEVRRPGFFYEFPVVDGAIQGWQRILDAGFLPRICSSPIENHTTVIAEKIMWLEKHFVPIFGSWVIETALFNRDKSGYDAIAMIDDRPTLRNIERASWQHVIFSRSYNENVDTNFRIVNWFDPALEAVLEKAQKRYERKRNSAS